MTGQVPLTPPDRERRLWLEAPADRRTGDGSNSGPGDGRGPLPATEGKRTAFSQAVENGWHHESRRFRPIEGRERLFMLLNAKNHFVLSFM